MCTKKNAAIYIILTVSFVFTACTVYNYEYEQDSFSFTSPKKDWEYYSDEAILFSINYKTDDITWESSEDGELGTGNHLYAYLSPGSHIITAETGGEKGSISVEVRYRNSGEVRNLITGMPYYPELKAGVYYPYIASSEAGVLNNLCFSVIGGGGEEAAANYKTAYKNADILPRDVRIEFNGNIPERNTTKPNLSSQRNTARTGPSMQRKFYVESTVQSGLPPSLIDFTLFEETSVYEIWADNNNINASAITGMAASLYEITSQVRQIWGGWEDVDKDGKVTVLITNKINEEGTAYGFFNPYDLYPENLDSASNNFNPGSNEKDVIYLAMPSGDPDDVYYYKIIAATFAHELTHLITFSRKTYGKTDVWDMGDKREIISVDEGLSHLSELLTGYSISGGNHRIVNQFLERTGHYSLFGRSADGFYDSNGMRGGITLFLSWLFWEKGGLEWDADGFIIDTGGVRFLRALIESDETGIKNLGSVCGEPAEQLFQKFLAAINYRRRLNMEHESVNHPATGEPVNLFTNMEYFNSLTNVSERINFPLLYGREDSLRRSLVSWSFAFLPPADIKQNDKAELTAKRFSGRVFLNFGY